MGGPRRYRLDAGLRRYGTVATGGSPAKLFRLTPAGAAVVDRLAAGEPVADSPLVAALVEAGAIHPVPQPGRFTVDDVTIVVPALGRPGRTPPGAVVVDDGSQPPIAGATLRLATNQGPAAARNAGLAAVTTPLVAFVDGDVEVPDGWLEPLLAHFGDDRVGLVAPRVRSRPGPGPLARYEAAHSPLDLGPEPAPVRAGTRVGYVPAAAIVCRAAAVRAIGGFDVGLRFGEDVDLVWRLDAAGWRCRYEPAVEVRHAPRATWRGWVAQRIGYGSSAAPLAERHPGAVAPARVDVASAAGWALTVAGRPALGFGAGAASAVALTRRLPALPVAAALRLAALGHLRAGDVLAQAVRRAWWPIVAIAAVRSRTARRVLLASAIAARHPLVVVDDLAYGIGVWAGMVRRRTLGPIVPELSVWRARPPAAAAAR